MGKPFWKHPLRLAGVLLAVTAAVFGTSLIKRSQPGILDRKVGGADGDGKVNRPTMAAMTRC